MKKAALLTNPTTNTHEHAYSCMVPTQPSNKQKMKKKITNKLISSKVSTCAPGDWELLAIPAQNQASLMLEELQKLVY